MRLAWAMRSKPWVLCWSISPEPCSRLWSWHHCNVCGVRYGAAFRPSSCRDPAEHSCILPCVTSQGQSCRGAGHQMCAANWGSNISGILNAAPVHLQRTQWEKQDACRYEWSKNAIIGTAREPGDFDLGVFWRSGGLIVESLIFDLYDVRPVERTADRSTHVCLYRGLKAPGSMPAGQPYTQIFLNSYLETLLGLAVSSTCYLQKGSCSPPKIPSGFDKKTACRNRFLV